MSRVREEEVLEQTQATTLPKLHSLLFYTSATILLTERELAVWGSEGVCMGGIYNSRVDEEGNNARTIIGERDEVFAGLWMYFKREFA
jgi:hypothetical protein